MKTTYTAPTGCLVIEVVPSGAHFHQVTTTCGNFKHVAAMSNAELAELRKDIYAQHFSVKCEFVGKTW